MAQSYILLSSAYRDRLLYPNAGDYIVPFGTIRNVNVSEQNVFFTTNPIVYTLPDFNFCWTNFSPNFSDPRRYNVTIVGGSAQAPVLDRSVNLGLLGIYPPNQVAPNLTLEQSPGNSFNILRGFVLTIGSNDTLQVRDIIKFDPTTVTVTLRNPFADFDLSAGPIEAQIRNLSENNKTDNLLRIFVNGDFLENSATVYFDFQVYLYNISLNEIRLIRKYQIDLQAMDLCDFFSDGWSITDQYWVLSRVAPMTYGRFEKFRGGRYYNSTCIDEYEYVERGRDYHVGEPVVLVHGDADSTDDAFLCRVVQIGPGGTLERLLFVSPSSHRYRIGERLFVRSLNELANMSAVVRILTTSLAVVVRLKGPIARPQDMETNYLIPVLTSPQYTFNQERQRLYLSPNNTIPVRNVQNVPFDLLSSQNAWGVSGIRKVIPLDTTVFLLHIQNYDYDRLVRFDVIANNEDDLPEYIRHGCLNFIIGQFSYEGVTPLNFTGTQITQSQMTCYEMSVVNLILPNQVINGSQGLLTSAYPYVFLEISNVSMPSSHNVSLLYSNNPNATRATFVCSISDVNNPRDTRFIKISSDGAVQTLKFTPFDNLRIRISFPNGQTFETEKTDTLIPCDPDPLLQISVVLEIRRL